MELSNSMEQAVRRHLTRNLAQSEAGDETCRCPLCRADTMARALSSLPPRYSTRRPGEVESDGPMAATVIDAVALARGQVERFPKHARDAAVAAGKPIWVVNFPLEEGFRAVDEVLRRHEGACDCWHCRCDAVAFALNRYPPRYGVEHEGQTHLFEQDRELIRGELSVFLDLAVKVVATAPRHEFRLA